MSKKKRKAHLDAVTSENVLGNAGHSRGRLTLVGLGIGNAQDVSLRALSVLAQADIVLAEDTREFIKFCRIHNLPIPKTFSYRDQIHARVMSSVLQQLREGKQILLVSDRGTPAISDPGYLLVRDVIAAGYEVDSVPGPTALIDALVISGLPTDRFTFLGFLPRTPSKQKKVLQPYAEVPSTYVAYESPFRVKQLLQTLSAVYSPNLQVVVARELTKVYQEIMRGTAGELIAIIESHQLKGECVVLWDTRELPLD